MSNRCIVSIGCWKQEAEFELVVLSVRRPFIVAWVKMVLANEWAPPDPTLLHRWWISSS